MPAATTSRATDAAASTSPIDPKEDLFVVYIMQSPKQRVPYRYLLKDMVYAAIAKPAAK